MIHLDGRWLVSGSRVFHACGPDVLAPLPDDRNICECSAPVTRRVALFRDWLASERRRAAAPLGVPTSVDVAKQKGPDRIAATRAPWSTEPS